jgi:hypothetical protein
MTKGGELGELNPLGGYTNNTTDVMTRVHVRNTFLDCAVDDPWVVKADANLRRQQTDSILHTNSMVRDELARVTCELEDAQFQPFPDSQFQAFQESQFQRFPAAQFQAIPEPQFQTFPDSKFQAFPTVPTIADMDQRGVSTEVEDDDEEGTEECPESSDSPAQNDSRVCPEIQARRELAANGGGLNGCTTVMMKQVPLKYTQRKLLREINASGFMGKYDFLYLPMDPRSHANRGFAFINMVSAGVAQEFYKKFHGQQLRHFTSDKPIIVLPADLQGFEENALQYASTAARQGGPAGRRTGHTKPIFFRALPAYIAAKLDDSNASVPQAQRNTKPVASRMPERPMRIPQETTQGMAEMLQQALFPAMLKANLPLLLAQTEQQAPVAAKRAPRFCVYCGKTRGPDHAFCPYCGNGF